MTQPCQGGEITDYIQSLNPHSTSLKNSKMMMTDPTNLKQQVDEERQDCTRNQERP